MRVRKCSHLKVVLFAAWVCLCGFAPNTFVWEKRHQGITESTVSVVAVDPQDRDTVYIGTTKGVYVSRQKHGDFTLILRPQGSNPRVNFIYIHPLYPNEVYVATDSGLYASDTRGGDWQKMYDVNDEQGRVCYSVTEHAGTLFLATGQGIHYLDSVSGHWKRLSGEFDNKAVYELDHYKKILFAATANKLYRIDIGSREIKKVFSAGFGGEAVDGENSTRALVDLAVSRGINPVVYCATTYGIFYSDMSADTWQRIATNGVPVKDITAISIAALRPSSSVDEGDEIFVSTTRGLFYFDTQKWQPLYKGIPTARIYDVVLNNDGDVYTATDKGLFFLPVEKALSFSAPASKGMCQRNQGGVNLSGGEMQSHQPQLSYEQLKERFRSEPTIAAIQKLAIDYAEVNSEKIKRWRRKAAKKAWLPNLSMGLDVDKNHTYSDSVYGSYSSGGQQFVGSDDKTAYDNLGWDVSLSWDLSDIIWNSDQTSIDSRSKMMVELREDILDQVTRLFFERRRLQIELLTVKGAHPSVTVDKHMRIDELTALIDALTGGEYSRLLKGANVRARETY